MLEQHIKLTDLKRAIAADMRNLKKRVSKAVLAAAKAGAEVCKSNVPGDFSEVVPGIKVIKDGGNVVIRSHAPHSDALERGPSMIVESFSKIPSDGAGNLPDIPTMTAWVRQYGSGRGNDAATRMVKKGLRGLVQRARRGRNGQGRSSPIDAPRQLAYAIIGSLMKHRKPYRFMQASLPAITALLDNTIPNAMDAPVTLSDAVAALAASSSIRTDRVRIGGAAHRLAKTSGRAARMPRKRG